MKRFTYIFLLVVFVFMLLGFRPANILYTEKDKVDCVDTTTINDYINSNKILYAYANSESEIQLEELVGGEFKNNSKVMEFVADRYIVSDFALCMMGKRNPNPFFSNRNYPNDLDPSKKYCYMWDKIGSLLVIKYDIGPYLSKNSPLGWLFGENGAFMLFEIINDDIIMINDILLRRQSEEASLADREFFKASMFRYGTEYVYDAEQQEYGYSKEIIDEVVIGDFIQDSAYMYCLNMDYVELPNNVKVIGDFAFSRCYNLRELKFSDSLKKIGEFSFHSCRSIKDVEIPNSVMEIGDYAFLYCDKLESVKLPDSLICIPKGLFQQCTNLKHIRIPEQVECIGNFAFLACDNLKIVVVDSKEPPSIMPFSFDKDNEIKFYVPNESLELYKTHELWGKMNIKPMYTTTPN